MGLMNAQPQQPIQQAQPAPQQQGDQQARIKQFQRILIAAQKLMYSDQTHKYFLQLLQGKNKVDAVSGAAVKIVRTLVDETKGQIDPSLIIPAGVAIVGDIMDFIEKTRGEKVTVEETHQAVAEFTKQMLASVGQGA